jgi:hypothetical protein
VFLDDEEDATAADADELAQQIQDCIETFLRFELQDRIRERKDEPDPDWLRDEQEERRRMENEP